MTWPHLWSSILLLSLFSLTVKFPDGRIRLYCKGADTVIYERLSPNSRHKDTTQTALDVSFLWLCSHFRHCIPTAVIGWKVDIQYVLRHFFSFLWMNIFCATDLCQRDLTDAVLVLQRHQHSWVRSLVQEAQRSPGDHEWPRCRPW